MSIKIQNSTQNLVFVILINPSKTWQWMIRSLWVCWCSVYSSGLSISYSKLYQRKGGRDKIRGSGKTDGKSLASPPDLTDREEDGGTQAWKTEAEKETGRGRDSRESGAVPLWREKALCSLSVDRLVKLKRAQGHRPEGFTGLCSFLCGSSMSTAAITDPPIPVWCPPVSTATWLITGLPAVL